MTVVDQSGYVPDADIELGQFIQLVRLFLRDFPELNRLIRGHEHSDRMIAWAVMDTLDDYNTTPPLLGQTTLATFPSSHLLLRGTVAHLIQSVGLLQTRNAIAFTDGGFSYNTDKSRALMAWLQMFQNEWEKKKLRLKTAVNIEAGFGGGVHSEYLWISSGWYGAWS